MVAFLFFGFSDSVDEEETVVGVVSAALVVETLSVVVVSEASGMSAENMEENCLLSLLATALPNPIGSLVGEPPPSKVVDPF